LQFFSSTTEPATPSLSPSKGSLQAALQTLRRQFDPESLSREEMSSGEPSTAASVSFAADGAGLHAVSPDIHLYLQQDILDPQISQATPNLNGLNKRPIEDAAANKKPVKRRKQEFDEHGNPIPRETRPRALRACDAWVSEASSTPSISKVSVSFCRCRRNKSRCELVDADNATLCRRCSARGHTCTWVSLSS
jgi:hypothetical protein